MSGTDAGQVLQLPVQQRLAALFDAGSVMPIVALIGPVCYGGASMLASLVQRRIFGAGSRMGMSGPRIVEAFAGPSELDANDPTAVEALFGGTSRTSLASDDRLCTDDPRDLREALAVCIDALPQPVPWHFEAEHRALLERLHRAGIELPRSPRPVGAALKSRLDGYFPGGFEALLGAGVVRGVRVCGGREVTITGLVERAPLGADAAWMIAESVITSVRARPDRPIVLLYDSPGHALAVGDESVLLSAYVAHLAQSLLWAREQGVAVSTWILGEASGGAYVALTAAAQRVLAFPGAGLRILPQASVSQVLTSDPGPDPGRTSWQTLGLVDDLLPSDALPAEVAAAAGLPARRAVNGRLEDFVWRTDTAPLPSRQLRRTERKNHGRTAFAYPRARHDARLGRPVDGAESERSRR